MHTITWILAFKNRFGGSVRQQHDFEFSKSSDDKKKKNLIEEKKKYINIHFFFSLYMNGRDDKTAKRELLVFALLYRVIYLKFVGLSRVYR